MCAGLYVYFTLQLKTYPEEAIHFIEYALLSYFLFKALGHQIHDWTIYLTGVVFVSFVGTIDEFLQWLMPQRIFDFKDIGLNTLAGGLLLLTIWKGVKPDIISKSVKKTSVKILVGIITIQFIFLGLCFSNTPDMVKRYSSAFNALSWLCNEEPMAEFGYQHKDPETGVFYSRYTLEELKKIDLAYGESFGKILPPEIHSRTVYEELIKIYTPYTNPFLYEFVMHVFGRDRSLNELSNTPYKKNETANMIYRKNLLLEKYFGNTLKHSMLLLPPEKVKELKETASLWKNEYPSGAGKMITSFNLKTAWMVILITLIIVWASGEFWKRRLDT